MRWPAADSRPLLGACVLPAALLGRGTVLELPGFLDGKSEYSTEFWRIACVELWLRQFDGA